jgi:TatD DNase family protein
VRVIGETGLDYFRTGPEGVAAQQDSFRWHIDLAKRTGKALQIHDRDAHEDVLRILAEEGAPDRTVLHCFSGDIAMARECVERGYHLSFSGTVTFKNAQGLRNALAITPLEQVLVETDAPYLTPSPHRGATNAPYLVPLTVRAMAGVLNVDVPSLCTAISATSERLYGPW